MKTRLIAPLAATLALGICWLAHTPAAQMATPSIRPVCAAAPAGVARCLSYIGVGVPAAPNDTAPSAIPGYHPADLQAAYNLTAASATQGAGQVLVDVLWYDDPNAESDLAVYRATFGLPPCTTQNGCFRKVDQHGGTHYPPPSAANAVEISLDLDMFSALCPNCKIILIEATTPATSDISAAVNEAVALGATEINNSYSFGGESASDLALDQSTYHHPGIVITAGSGDNGYGPSAPGSRSGPQYPAASPYVTAVGGTTLKRAPGTPRGWSETAWSCASGLGCALLGGAGSGCSAFEPKPLWQTDALCHRRTIADVAAVASPFTGVSVYDSVPYLGLKGWLPLIGGTSASAPLIAAVYALAGNAASVIYGSYPYGHTASLNDVTSGSNGSCGGIYLCTAKQGYDGPTGLGTPNGTGAF